MDHVNRERRSHIMRLVKTSNTGPEIAVRRILHRLGFRFRLHGKDLPGKPDVVMPKWRAVVFIHGCFWHRRPGCRKASTPKTRVDFWKKKFAANVKRDRGVRIRTDGAPQVMAGLRNAAIGLLRLSGVTNIAEALRENLYHVGEILTKLGILNL